MNRKPVVLAMKVGNMGEPTTLFSVLPLPGELGVLLAHQQPQVGRRSGRRMISGMMSTWMMNRRGMMIVAREVPPQRNEAM